MTATPSPLLEARDVTKSFGGAKALAGASLTLSTGEVHALLGANGAGKSTLSRVVSGHIRRDGGALTLSGQPLNLRSPREAIDAGVALVMQETSLAPDLTVLENIFLPHLARPGRLSRAGMRAKGEAILDELGQADAVSLDQEVRELSAAQRQLVEIAKALALEAKLVIFDEPTTSLSAGEVERLFDVMQRMKSAGCALGFVSHRLEEVFAVCDRITVMREGRTVAASVQTSEMTQTDLIRHMVGRELSAIYAPRGGRNVDRGAPALTVRNLKTPPLVKDVSFDLHRGEILGLGGLVGAGRSETVEALFGLRAFEGEAVFEGKPFKPKNPRDAIRSGFGFVAEDRRSQSIVPDLSVRENLLLGHLAGRRGPTLGYAALEPKIKALMARLELPAARLEDDSLLNFSGGMQQKILIARWLLLDPKVLLLDEPTKGVDIGTRASIYEIVREIAGRGVAVLLVSSDFEELLGLADRIVVVSDGRSIASVPSEELDEEKLTLFAAPRSSHERSRRLLDELSREHGGAAFWGIVDDARVFCLDVVGAGSGADPGFSPGATPRFEETRVGEALRRRDAGFVRDPSSGLSSLVVEVKSPRGHELGTVGLVLPADATPPEAAPVRAAIEKRFREAV